VRATIPSLRTIVNAELAQPIGCVSDVMLSVRRHAPRPLLSSCRLMLQQMWHRTGANAFAATGRP